MSIIVDKRGHAYIDVFVYIDSWKQIRFMIDTGFSSGFMLPLRYEKYMQTKSTMVQRYRLADGSTREFVLYEIKVKYKETIRKSCIGMFAQTFIPLVGVEFLKNTRYTHDLINYRAELKGK